MQAHIKLGQVHGVKIGLHFSWILIAFLITLSLSTHFGVMNPQWGRSIVLLISVFAAVLFFATIVIHELSHALVAQSRGMTVESIVLFAFGGVAQIEKDAADAKTEFWIGIVGPITSLVIGVICLAITWTFGWSADLMSPQPPLIAMLIWLGLINVALAVFNMVPGYPLDGGRVLRAIIWWASGNVLKATRIASWIGHFIALSFIVIGIYRFFNGAGFGALWLSLIQYLRQIR
jgi:Zn-dependent protease